MALGYFYLISALPELSLNDKHLKFNLISFRQSVSDQLSPNDLEYLRVLYYRYDIINLVNLIKDNPEDWQEEGNYSKDQLTEMLGLPDSLPVFMKHFYEDTRKKWSLLSEKELINRATTHFIDWSENIDNRFLRRWLRFDYNLKNLLIWLNSNRFGLDPTNEVLGNQYEAEYLRQTRSDEINLKSWDFRYREVMTHFDNPNIAIREAQIDEMRWHYLSELEEAHNFGIERLLGFAIRLQMINRNIINTEVQGKKQLMDLLSNIRGGYKMPQNFTVSNSLAQAESPGLVEMIDEETKEIST